MMSNNEWLYYGSSFILGMVMVIFLIFYVPQGTLVLRHAGCALAIAAGAAPSATEAGCLLEGKYDIGRSFTEIKPPNGRKLLLSNTEIVGVIIK